MYAGNEGDGSHDEQAAESKVSHQFTLFGEQLI
jgi:hypothetical protein